MKYVCPYLDTDDLPMELDDALFDVGFRNLPQEQKDTYHVHEIEGRVQWSRVIGTIAQYTDLPMSVIGGLEFRLRILRIGDEGSVIVLDGQDTSGAHEIVAIARGFGGVPIVISTRRVLRSVEAMLGLLTPDAV